MGKGRGGSGVDLGWIGVDLVTFFRPTADETWERDGHGGGAGE